MGAPTTAEFQNQFLNKQLYFQVLASISSPLHHPPIPLALCPGPNPRLCRALHYWRIDRTGATALMIPFPLLLAGALVLLVVGVADALSGEPLITSAIIILSFPPA